MLELNAVGIYRLRRRLRHVHDVRIGKHLQMLIGCLQHFKRRFDFYLKLLLLSQDNESTKPDRISRICHSIENLLTEYLSEVL
ncbi:unnamed protein product [Anisakis simplex]|uniref:Transposase n=1 Tax=Anisakis simplex TaxID=6269 RepID=A0A0M3JGV6_ANISI|nr:unnamed protein product [Anisakis simplex]VDK27612.1 unnamed protein product [Anisakis simplex]